MSHLSERPIRTIAAGFALLCLTAVVARQPPSLKATGAPPARPMGDHPAAPAPFGTEGHLHHPPGSIVGEATPDLIPTDKAVGLFMRMLSTLKAKDQAAAASPTGGVQPMLDKFIQRIEKATNHRFNVFDRANIEQFASLDVKGRRAERPEQAWDGLKSRVSPLARRALERFLNENVKRQTKVLR